MLDLDVHDAPELVTRDVLVISSKRALGELSELWATGRLCHLLVPETPTVELAAVLERMNAAAPLGPTGLLGPVEFRHLWTLTDSAEKAGFLDELGRRASVAGLNRRQSTRLVSAAEELVTNALYNAPIDEAGRRLSAHKARSERVAVERGQLKVELSADDERVALVVTDAFGSLDAQTVFANLARCFRAEHDQIADKAGGAGLGLFTVLAAANHFVLSVGPGRTEASVVIDKRPGRVAGRCFNWFEARRD